jgi:hypothetical protein
MTARTPGRPDGFRLGVQESLVPFPSQPLQRRGGRRGFVVDPDALDAFLRRRQFDDQRAAENGIRFLQVKRPADPNRLVFGSGTQHVSRLLPHIVDHQLFGVEHELRGAWVEALEFEAGDPGDGFALEIDPQFQLQVRGSELIDIGIGVIVETRIKRSGIDAARCAQAEAAEKHWRENRNSPARHDIRIPQ